MEECPCRYCTKDTGRSDICHGVCERYKTWKKNHDAQVAAERQQRQIDWSARTGHWYQSRSGHWKNKNLVRRRK